MFGKRAKSGQIRDIMNMSLVESVRDKIEIVQTTGQKSNASSKRRQVPPLNLENLKKKPDFGKIREDLYDKAFGPIPAFPWDKLQKDGKIRVTKAEYTYENGSTYKGEWIIDQRDGSGTQQWKNG